MTHNTPKSQRPPRKAGPLAFAALLASGLLQPLLPAFAAGTAAGEQISNTATATYTDDPTVDPNDPATDPNDIINATSNTVTVTVAEVAGLTAVPAGFNDLDGGAVEDGDILEYIFDVTNVGNADTDVFIPGTANIGTENFTPTTVEIIDAAGTVLATVPAGGDSLGNLTLPDLAPDEVLKVRVTGTPAAGTPAGAPVGVTLGSTGPNDNNASTQNQPDDSDPANGDTGPLPQDIRTIDADPTDPPINGEREASATQSIPFASSVTPLALATVTKVAADVDPGLTGNANDDLITYDLGMSVADVSPNAAFSPTDLEGTPITVDGALTSRILVSDAIPVGTELSSVAATPANWQVIYSATPTTTDALSATWTATAPTLSTVTRIGFIYTGGATLAPGTTVSPFTFTVLTSSLNPTGGQVANIAQVFGETVGDPDDNVVYDESGDNNPNNFNDNGTPPDPTGTDYDPATDDGVADPVANGTDTGNDNSGTGPDGEDNVVNLGDVAGSDDILNGPQNVPGATGPTDDNDDFTNQTTNVPAGVGPGDTFDPDPSGFDNTIQNPASAGFIADVTIEPISPTQAEGGDDSPLTGQYGANGDIPDGTLVTITATDENGDVQQAVYTWNGTTNLFVPNVSRTNGTNDATFEPVNVGDLPAGQTLDYSVEVNLPAGTSPNDEIPIPILAFADDDPTNTPGFTGESTNNVTIDRVYTGFMELTKEVQILDENGVIIQPWTSNQATLDAVDVEPDYQIEYRISYNNISTPIVGNGNTGLTAYSFEVVEDGNAVVNGSATNNWASFTDHEQNTTADRGTVEYFTNSADTTELTTADPVAGTKVDKYENDIGQVDPGQGGQFQFRRKIQ